MGPQFQTADVVVEHHQHPVMGGLPNIWQHEEEWYSWEESPRAEGFNILATIDEDSYSPVQNFMGNTRDLRMGDHPVVWSNCVGKGRTVYAAMGHKAEAFEQAQFRKVIANALEWLIDAPEQGCSVQQLNVSD
jgi:type 1 glutamine amidotransferase